MLMLRVACCCLLFLVLSCRPTPFRVDTLTIKESAPIEDADPKLVESFATRIDSALAERYKQKKSPSFAIINGYYRLPEAHPYGAATIVRSYSYQTYFEGIIVDKDRKPYAITPIAGDDAQSMEAALNALLSVGVVIKEISLTDAVAIAQAEAAALKSDKRFASSKVLPPNVDYLMSIYPSSTKNGRVLIGRVIKRDGTLMAFRVIYRGASTHLVGSLITTLFEDTIRRI